MDDDREDMLRFVMALGAELGFASVTTGISLRHGDDDDGAGEGDEGAEGSDDEHMDDEEGESKGEPS